MSDMDEFVNEFMNEGKVPKKEVIIKPQNHLSGDDKEGNCDSCATYHPNEKMFCGNIPELIPATEVEEPKEDKPDNLIVSAIFTKLSKKKTYKVFEIQNNGGKVLGNIYVDKNIDLDGVVILLKE